MLQENLRLIGENALSSPRYQFLRTTSNTTRFLNMMKLATNEEIRGKPHHKIFLFSKPKNIGNNVIATRVSENIETL
ncbi:hypothetical protein ACJX0J_016000, partial [Zea mays]